MKQILASGLALVTSFALAVSCHHDSGLQTVPPSDPTSTPGSGVAAPGGTPPSGTQTWSSGSNGGGWGSGSGSGMGSGSGY